MSHHSINKMKKQISMSLWILSIILVSKSVLSIRNMTVFGNATLGYYYLEAYVGTPEQKQALILDTGSNLTIFPCQGCDKCRDHINKNFDPEQSSTFEKIDENSDFLGWRCQFFNNSKGECAFHQGYTEGSAYIGRIKEISL
jgi:hypothetical protein